MLEPFFTILGGFVVSASLGGLSMACTRACCRMLRMSTDFTRGPGPIVAFALFWPTSPMLLYCIARGLDCDLLSDVVIPAVGACIGMLMGVALVAFLVCVANFWEGLVQEQRECERDLERAVEWELARGSGPQPVLESDSKKESDDESDAKSI